MKSTYSEKISIGTRSLYAEWSGEGTPVIVLDAGGVGAGCWTGDWNTIWNELADLSLVCRYDRANTGRSDLTTSPRTSQQMVEDLRLMLKSADFQPPYILVGHSFGGLNMQLYARYYPNEVAGLVLIDSVHPDLIERCYMASKSLGDNMLSILNGVLKGVDWKTSTEQVKKAPPLTSMPLVVITRGRETVETQVWNELQAELAAQLPNSCQIIARNSGHAVQMDEPEVVISAILEMVQDRRTIAK